MRAKDFFDFGDGAETFLELDLHSHGFSEACARHAQRLHSDVSLV